MMFYGFNERKRKKEEEGGKRTRRVEVKEKEQGDHVWPAKPQIVIIWPFSENIKKKLLYQVHKIV